MADGIADPRRDSLAEIKQLLKVKAPDFRKVAQSTQSLRHSYPSVDVAESIYNEADRVSVFSESAPIIASSKLRFDFDDAVAESTAYRRAMKNDTLNLPRDEVQENFIEGKEKVTADTHRDPGTGNKKDGHKHERRKSQTEQHDVNVWQDGTHKDPIVGKVDVTISTNPGTGSKNEGRIHHVQMSQTKEHSLVIVLPKTRARKDLVRGDEEIKISNNRGPDSKKERHNHQKQKSHRRQRHLLCECTEAGEELRESKSKTSVRFEDTPDEAGEELSESKSKPSVRLRDIPDRRTPGPRTGSCQSPLQEHDDEAHEDLIDFSDDAIVCQAAKVGLPQDLTRVFEELVGLRFPLTVRWSQV